MNSFGVILSALRREKKLSQRKAASDLGVSQALLSHYENGAREPKLEFVVKACDYYSVTADYALGRTSEKAPQYLHAPNGCEGAQSLISAVCSVFKTLDEMSDQELSAAVANYLLIPVENIETLLHAPDTQYDPARDAALKLAEAAFMNLTRRLMAESTRA